MTKYRAYTLESLLFLVKFKTGVLVKKKNPLGTSFGPSGPQSGNQGGVYFIMIIKIINENGIRDTQHRFSNYPYHASLSPCGSLGESWGN